MNKPKDKGRGSPDPLNRSTLATATHETQRTVNTTQYLDDWSELCKTGKIGVCKRKAKKRFIQPLKFQNYNNVYDAFVENNGYSVEICINATEDEVPTLKGGCLDGEYILHNIHFHWESDHTLNGKRFPLEAHLVHFKKEYKDLKSALKNPDGLCILAVMFKIETCFNPKLNLLISSTEDVARSVKRPAALTGGIVVDNLLPKNRKKFFMHQGSLSQSKCRKNVKWIVFDEILPIGEEQVYQLSRINLVKQEMPQNQKCEQVVYYTARLTVSAIGEFIMEAMGFGN